MTCMLFALPSLPAVPLVKAPNTSFSIRSSSPIIQGEKITKTKQKKTQKKTLSHLMQCNIKARDLKLKNKTNEA